MKRILILLPALLLGGSLFAQNNDDQVIAEQTPADSVFLDTDREALLHRADSLTAMVVDLIHSSDYDRAIVLAGEAAEIRKEVLGDRDPYYAMSLNNLISCYFATGNYDRAIELGTEVAEIVKEAFGEDNMNRVGALHNLTSCYFTVRNYEKAIECETEVLEILRRIVGERDMQCAMALNNLSDCYRVLNDYEKAIEFGTESTEIKGEVLGENSPEYATSLSKLANCHYAAGNYEKALELMTEAKDITEEFGGKSNPTYITLLNNIAMCYRSLGEYEKAVEFGTMTVEARREADGDRNKDYALALSNLAAYYLLLGNYEKALENEKEATEIRREILGERHPDYASSLSDLANYCSGLGNYEKAVELETRAAEIYREALGEKHPDYATALNNLASFYNSLGNYEKALELGTRAVQISKEVLGEDHPDYAMSLGNLASYCGKLGNYDKAVELGTEAAEIRKKTLGEKHPSYAMSLYNLAYYYESLGNYEKAIELGTQAAEIRREVLGDRHRDYAMSLNDLATCCYRIGNYDKALELGTRVAEIYREVLGERHPYYATSLNNLAYYLKALGNYEKALEIGAQAAELLRETKGENHPDYAQSLNNVVGYYYGLGDYGKALEKKQSVKKIYAENLRNNFSFLTSHGRSLYWDSVKSKIGDGTAYCVVYPSDESNELAYDVELIGKGILLSSEREFDKVIRSSGDEELLAKFEQLRQDRLQLEVYYKKAVEDRPADEVTRIEREALRLEKDLIAGSEEYGDFTRSLAIEWADVRDALRENDLAVEFAKVNADSTDYYVALMLRKGWDAPKCVNLGTAESFKPYLALGNNDLYKSREFSEKIWAGIVEAAELQEGDNVYFAPDGIFYQLGIEYLPVAGEDGEVLEGGSAGRIMADKYNLRRLSSTKELCFEPSAVAESSAVLYGGLKYDARLKSESESGSNVKIASAESAGRDVAVEMLIAQRGAEADSLTRANIAYLPGTLTEADTLATMLLQRKIDYREYTGYDGTEESFKALTGNAPKLIHIATHGFYLSPTSAEIMSQERHNDFLALGEERQNNVIDYSMSRSGLLFAGAQSAWFGEPVPAGEDDGILTAQEIAGLDLRGADLAVLSACSTAGGDVTGDGVAGLQRGFKKAGVKTLLLTLWEVNDRATRIFMTEFYENLISGKSKRQSFEAAQSYLRTYEDWIEYEIDDPDAEPVYDDTLGDYVRPTKTVRELGKPYENPQYWAAFIMLD